MIRQSLTRSWAQNARAVPPDGRHCPTNTTAIRLNPPLSFEHALDSEDKLQLITNHPPAAVGGRRVRLKEET